MEGGLLNGRTISRVPPDEPMVSVITVVRNGEMTLERTIQSVIKQDYKNLEYIVIDGASSDKTCHIIKKYHDQINYWISEPDKGISDAFNKGIKVASGSWINFLNSGDYYLDDHVISKTSQLFSQAPIITGFSKCGAGTLPRKRLHNSTALRRRAKISHQASFVHKDVFSEIGFFDERYQIRMDYDFWLRALSKYSFVMMDETLVNYAPVGLSSISSTTKIFYEEEKRANHEHAIDMVSGIDLYLNFKYYADRVRRFMLGR
jgi:glycosyltransferase involved in cell wall biosynthesis